jgi:hypothetical protein
MIRKIIKLFLFVMTGVILCACPYPDYPAFPKKDVEGYRPVYATETEAGIEFQQARPLKKPGKIYVYGQYLLVNEPSEGIHVIDNSNPTAPNSIGFLRVYGNTDMAVRNDVLYVDHIGDLVALRIVDMDNIKELSRTPSWGNDLPPGEGGYFECVDPRKGEVIGWISTTLKNPECFKQNPQP